MHSFRVLPVFAPTDVGTIDPSKVITYKEAVDARFNSEVGAYDHWLFTSDLYGLINKKPLTSVAGTSPLLSNGTLKLSGVSASISRFMNTDFKSPAATGFTVCIVAKSSVAPNADIALAGYQTTQTGSASIFASSGNLIKGNAINLGFGSAPTISTPINEWFFAASSYSSEALVKRNLVVASKTVNLASNTFTGTGKIVNPDGTAGVTSVGLGASYMGIGLTATDIEFAEFIIFNSPKSIAELSEIYQRSKSRMTAKGINI